MWKLENTIESECNDVNKQVSAPISDLFWSLWSIVQKPCVHQLHVHLVQTNGKDYCLTLFGLGEFTMLSKKMVQLKSNEESA